MILLFIYLFVCCLRMCVSKCWTVLLFNELLLSLEGQFTLNRLFSSQGHHRKCLPMNCSIPSYSYYLLSTIIYLTYFWHIFIYLCCVSLSLLICEEINTKMNVLALFDYLKITIDPCFKLYCQVHTYGEMPFLQAHSQKCSNQYQ